MSDTLYENHIEESASGGGENQADILVKKALT